VIGVDPSQTQRPPEHVPLHSSIFQDRKQSGVNDGVGVFVFVGVFVGVILGVGVGSSSQGPSFTINADPPDGPGSRHEQIVMSKNAPNVN